MRINGIKQYLLYYRTKGKVPVYYVLGENDQQTPVQMGITYFHEIVAPEKNGIL